MPFGFRMSAVVPAVAALAVPAIVCNVAHAQSLKVGSPAPKLAVSKWVKGQPVTLEKGKIYVVEFWATWCPPCLKSIPKLTEMQKKYQGKATIVGVSIAERGEDIPTQVTNFVNKMGSQMDYNVALDEASGTMARTWMDAAGQEGIPAAFIIGKDGNIAWIGNPLDPKFEATVGQVVAGTYDAKAEAARQKAAQEEEAKLQAEVQAIQPIAAKAQSLAREGKFAEAVAELDKIKTENPGIKAGVAQMKFSMLINTDAAAASKLAKESAGLFKEGPQAAMALNNMAWELVDPSKERAGADYDVALSLAEKAVAMTKGEDATVLDTLACAYYRKGNLDKAIETQQKAVKLINAEADADENIKKELNDRLEMFKKKKSGN
jgi:thiol-disulfide isomerase/thioredoxin